MGRLERFEAKSEKISLDGLELEISALKAQDGSIIVRAQKDPENYDGLLDLVYASLIVKQPDITKEELNNMDIRLFGKLATEVFRINGFEATVKKPEEMTD